MPTTNTVKLYNVDLSKNITALILDEDLFGTGSDYPKVINTTGFNWSEPTNILASYFIPNYIPFHVTQSITLYTGLDNELQQYYARVIRGQDTVLHTYTFPSTTNKAYFCVALDGNQITRTGVLYIDATSLAFLCPMWDNSQWMTAVQEHSHFFETTIAASGFEFTDIYGAIPSVGYNSPTLNDNNALVKDIDGNPLKIDNITSVTDYYDAVQELLGKLRYRGTNVGVKLPWQRIQGTDATLTFDNNSTIYTAHRVVTTNPYQIKLHSENGSDFTVNFEDGGLGGEVENCYVTDANPFIGSEYSPAVWLVKSPYSTDSANGTVFPICVVNSGTNPLSVAIMRLGTSTYNAGNNGYFYDPETRRTILEKTNKEQTEQEEDEHTGDSQTNKTNDGAGGSIEEVTSPGDTIPETGLPTTAQSKSTGFCRIFKMSDQQMQALAADFNDNSVYTAIRKLFETNPMDVIISFHAVPGTVPAETTATNISFYGTTCPTATGNRLTSEYYSIDCGSITLGGYDTFMDYAPNTKATLYLPYIGYQQIDIDHIIHKTVHLQYIIDAASGALMAELHDGTRIIGTWSGTAMKTYPITNVTRNALASSILGIATQAGIGIATGGFSVAGLASQAASAAMSIKPEISMRGGAGGPAGFLMCKVPQIILERPDQIQPSHYGEHVGYPANIEVTLGDVNGYCEFESVHLEGITCTEDEKNIIEGYMKGGIYL